MMKTVVVLLLALLLIAPAAQAAEIQVKLSTGHPPEHKLPVPESRRTSVPLKVSIASKEFVCVQPGKVTVDATITYEPEWAGVSLNPKASTIDIPQGQPGADPKEYPGSDIMIDVFWGENRPKTNAQVTYKIEIQERDIKIEGGPCLPDATKKGATASITFKGDDIVDPIETTGAVNCAVTPDDPACLEPVTEAAPAESPSISVLMMAGALFVVAMLRRRRL